jgi:hypothetical protein
MKKIVYILAIGLSLGATNSVKAQKFEMDDLTKEDYLSDMKLMKEIIETQHPDAFRFQSKQQWDSNFKDIFKNIEKTPTYLEFLNNIPIINDGHLSVTTAEEFYIHYTKDKLKYFPIPLILLDNRLFVNIKCGEIPFLSEITAINKKPTAVVIEDISSHMQGEGGIKTGIEDEISNSFSLSYSLYVEPYADAFDIEYKEPASQNSKKISLKSANFYEINYRSDQKISPVNKAEIRGSIDYQFYKKELTGKLTVNTFNLSERTAYQSFSDFFRRINKEGYKNVIIDIRNNGGGDPKMAAILYSFIAKGNFENKFNYKAKSTKFSHTDALVGSDGSRLNEADIEEYENFLYQRFNLKDGSYIGNERLTEGVLESFPPDKDAFLGNVYVVTSGITYSAAVYFAKLIQDNKRGVIIGKETGGNANNTFAGYFLNYKLPKTKAVLRFSFTDLYFGENPPKVNTGIIPNRQLTTQERLDFLSREKDPDISYVIEKLI